MGIVEKTKNIIQANLNHLIEKAENPEKMLKKMILDMEDCHRQMRLALFELNKEKGWLENRLAENRKLAAKWEERAQLAVKKERDDLAREALASKKELERSGTTIEGVLQTNKAHVSEIESSMSKLRTKIEEAKVRHLEMSMNKLQAAQVRAGLTETLEDKKEDAFARLEIDEELKRMKAEVNRDKRGKSKS